VLPDVVEYVENFTSYDSDYDGSYISHSQVYDTGLLLHSSFGGGTYKIDPDGPGSVIVHSNPGISNPSSSHSSPQFSDAETHEDFAPFIMTFPFNGATQRNDTQHTYLYNSLKGMWMAIDPVPIISKSSINKFIFMEGWDDSASMGSYSSDEFGYVETDGAGTTTYTRSGFGQTGGCMGFKHGVRNITPIMTTSVFRYGRFGQFRDMLEQRKFARFYKTFSNSMNQHIAKYGGTTYDSHITQGPLIIKFVEQNTENEVEDPETTTSSNLSQFATSSLPFFDFLYSMEMLVLSQIYIAE
jgi:hypothetical protein